MNKEEYICCVCSDEIQEHEAKQVGKCIECGNYYHKNCGSDLKCEDCQLMEV